MEQPAKEQTKFVDTRAEGPLDEIQELIHVISQVLAEEYVAQLRPPEPGSTSAEASAANLQEK